MTNLDLPRDLTNGTNTLTATTAAEYWNLTYRGFAPVDGPATASLTYDELTPAQKRQRTLDEKKAAEAAQAKSEGSQDPGDAAGTANVVE